MSEEIWKPVALELFGERYDVSSLGRVKSKWNGNILSPGQKAGYSRICLSKDGTRKDIGVHILVAMTFLENTENLSIVNHKNGQKSDNRVENLEWVTRSQNAQHALATGLTNPRTVAVLQYSHDGETFIAEFSSIKEAGEKTGVASRQICTVCKGNAPTAGGFVWKYKNGVDSVSVDQSDVDGIAIPDWPHYMVTQDGRVYSEKAKKYLKPSAATYSSVTLNNNGDKIEAQIHVLVAKAYLPNPKNLPNVNHKNGNKKDNHVENLEWVSKSENMIHAIKTLQCRRSAKAVIQFDLDGVFIQKFKTIKDAGESVKLMPQLVVRVCRGKRQSSGGFIWRYARDCHKHFDGTWYIATKVIFED